MSKEITEKEINEILRSKLEGKNILFQEQALNLVVENANGSLKEAIYMLKKVIEFAKFHNDNVLSTWTTNEALKQLADFE